MIAKQIEPTNTGAASGASYDASGALTFVELKIPNKYLTTIYNVDEDSIYSRDTNGNKYFNLQGAEIDKLKLFLDEIRHLREPDEALGDYEGIDEPDVYDNLRCRGTLRGINDEGPVVGCKDCADAYETLKQCECSEPSDVSKDLEEAIGLLREFAARDYPTVGRVTAFLSRVGGNND